MIFVAQQQQGPPSDAMGIGLAIAAVALVLGWGLTRWQRDRMRFALMRTALEKGVTRFPGTPPYWLVSLRQGITLVALGLGLGVVGGGAWWLVRNVPMPQATPSLTQPSAQSAPAAALASRDNRDMGRPPRPDEGPPWEEEDGGRPPRPEGRDDREPGHGDDRGPQRQRRANPPPVDSNRQGGGERQAPPPRESLEKELWHRAELQKTLGLVAVGAGFILMLLGVVRVGFAKIEQRFAAESDEATVY